MLQVSDLHRLAKARLQGVSGNPKRLALFHTAIALGSSFLLTAVIYLFDLLIADTGGLAGLGIRSVLTTAQSVLTIVITAALPFWQMGILYAALQWVKGKSADFESLLQGFRRFGSALGLLFLRGGLFLALAIPISYAGTAVFMLTPFAAPLLEILTPMMEQGVTPEQLEALVTPEFTAAALQASVPLLIISGILYVAVAIPIFYRIRFADFAVMEGLSAGKALLKSFAVTGKNCLQVFKLDLTFWWFYLLQILSAAVCNADTILPALGVSLPVSGAVAALAFYALGTVCQCVLLWQYEAHRVTVYGLAYGVLDGTIGTDTADTQG